MRLNRSHYQGDVAVIPRVVVDQCCPIPHARYLISIVPPGHDAGIVSCVLSQPVVGFAEIVEDVTCSVTQGPYSNKEIKCQNIPVHFVHINKYACII